MKPEKICIPNDIKSYIALKYFKKLTLFLLVAGAEICFLLFCKSVYAGFRIENQILLFILFAILPFGFSGILKLLFDRSWHGNVVNIKVWETTETPPGTISFFIKTHVKNITLRLKSDSGRVFKKTIEKMPLYTAREKSSITETENLPLKIGDTVCHINGTNFATNITKNIEYPRRCVICGYYEESNENKCSKCGHTLITS
jgi:Predicted NADH:ubiquinone oxidoreductase, subunit RnfG